MKALYNKCLVFGLALTVSLFLSMGTKVLAAYPPIDGGNSTEWITNVTLNAIDNASAADPDGYGDYLITASTAQLTPGSTYTLTVTINPDTGEKISAFFDWNGDEDFTDPGEEILVTPNIIQSADPTSFTASVLVTVPANAALGGSRMRVVLSYLVNDLDPVQSSGTLPAGEAEDYSLLISNAGSLDPIITASAGDGGTIDPLGAISLTSGSSQTFDIAVVHASFFIEDVIVDGQSVGAVSTYTFSNVVVNHTIHATFSAVLAHTINAGAEAGGRISPSGNVRVFDSNNQNFSILADSGHQVADVLIDGGSVGGVSSYSFNNVTIGHTIAASFSLDGTYPAISSNDFSKEWISNVNFGTINNSSNAEGFGSFLDLSTAVQQGGEYPIAITIHPQADENITVYIDWNQDGDFSDPNEETPVAAFSPAAGPHLATITVPADATTGTTRMRVVLRYFESTKSSGDLAANNSGGEAEDYTVIVAAPVPAVNSSAGANGSILPAGLIPVTSGADSDEFVITPDPGYFINNVLVDGVNTGEPFPTSYTFLAVTVTHTIHVEFADIPTHTITATSGANGSISPSGQINVLEGTNQVFTIAPDQGFVVDDVVVDSMSVGSVISYTFPTVTTPHSIAATFVPGPPFPWTIFLPAIIHSGTLVPPP